MRINHAINEDDNIMPVYTFREKANPEEYFEVTMRIAELDAYKEMYPELEQCHIFAPAITRQVGEIDGKIDGGFQDVIQKVAEAHPSSPLADRYRRPSAKEVKTREVVKKHLGNFNDSNLTSSVAKPKAV